MYMNKIVLGITLVLALGVAPVFAESEGGVRVDQKKQQTMLDASAIACIKSAVIKREDALIGAFDAYAASLRTARTTRKDALSVAWDTSTPNERRTLVKAADKSFADATKTARNTWNTARRNTWKVFETDRKVCVPSATSLDTGSATTDSSL